MLQSLVRILLLSTGVALLIVGGVRYYNDAHNRHLADVAKQQSVEIHAKADKARTERQSLLAAIRAADKVGDPLKRCLEFPDAPPLHWDAASVAEWCRYSTLNVVGVDEIKAKLDAGNAAAVDRIFDDYATQDASDASRRGILFRAFGLFSSDNPATGNIIERWVEASPRSANALAARGIFRLQAGFFARGGDYARDTPQANFDAMRHFVELAIADFEASLKISPRFIVPAAYLISANMLAGDRKDVAMLAHRAIEIGPDEPRVYMFWAMAASPLWGGSIEDLDEAANAARARATGNPLMALAEARARYYRHVAMDKRLSTADYLDVLAIAPDDLALGALGSLPLASEDVALVTQLIRFWPGVHNYLNAAWALTSAHQPELAGDYTARAAAIGYPMTSDLASYARALFETRQWEPAAAIYSQILAANPRSKDAMRLLAVIYEMHLGRHADAVAMAQRLVEAYPDSDESWLTMAAVTKKTDTAKYCEAQAKAYAGYPKRQWDSDHQCGSDGGE